MTSASSSIVSYLRLVVAAWREDTREDAELLTRFAEVRDEAAFATLVCRHGPLVWQTCRRILGATPDAEDAFQATFLALASKAGRFPVESLAGWLHRVARRTSLHAQAAARRCRDLERYLQAVGEPKTEENTNREELYAALDEELAGLPEKLRVPLLLHYLEGRSQVEVARLLGCARRVLQKRLTQGEAILRERLERRGLTVGIGSMAALLGGSTAASAVPARLIGSTARAAVAFRSGALTGGAAEAARVVLRTLPSSTRMTIMRKSLWIVLACVCSLGVGLAAWQASSAHSEAVEAPDSAVSPEAAAGTDSGGVDRFGDPLPQGALARLGTLRLRHVGLPVHAPERGAMVFSRDGKMLFTACPDNPIGLWDAATGKLLRSFGDRNIRFQECIALSPDGNTLAAIKDNGSIVSLWEIATGKLLRQLVQPEVGIHALAFSRDGRILLSAGEDNGVDKDNHRHRRLRVWEVATGEVLRDEPLRNAEKAGELFTFIFSPDGKTLASIHDVKDNKVIYLWEVASGKEIRHLSLGERRTIPRGAIAFSPDSRFLAVSSFRDNNPRGGAVHLWEVATGKEVRKLTPDKIRTYSLAFSPDGKVLATGSGFGSIRLWEAATGKELRQCQGYRAHVTALAFSPDGSTLASLAGLHDHTARLWEVASGKERTRTSRGHVGPVLSVSFSPDGKSLISEGRDGLVGLWNPETGQEQRPPLRAGDFQALAALSADGKTVLSVGNIFSPNYQNLDEVAYQTPTQICVWDRTTGQKLRQFPGPVGAAQSLALSPDGKILVLRFVHSVHLLEVATGKEMRWFNAAQCCVALSPDGKTLAMTSDEKECRGTVHFYATASGKDLGSIKAQSGGVSCLAFSSDGQTLAAGGWETIKMRDAKGREVAESIPTIRLWHIRADKKGWKESGILVGHQNTIWCATFSSDSKTLASTSGDGTLRLWEVATGRERRRFAEHGGNVWCLAFAPDGRRLAAGGNDTTILVWDVTGRLQSGRLRSVKLSAREMKGLWADLAGPDAARAGQAIWTLAVAPAQTIPLLQEHLRPVAPVGGKHIARLIADLDSETFAVRQKAADELAKLGEVAEPALRQALAKPVSLDMRRRLEQLLEPLEKTFPLSGEELRSHRALEVLGQIGTPEALPLLEELAHGEPGARLTREAQAVLKRLGTQVNGTKQ